MINLLKRFWPLIILFILEFILFLTNYKPGTFLVGWDNLYPELNFNANLQRNLFSTWQEYRGLGLFDGMAHAANLPHTLLLWLLSLVLPLNLLRYLFTFSMHLFGGIGIYFLIKKLIGEKYLSKFIALFGSLFYLFNITAVQMFYAPLEVFSIHFAFLPWLTLLILNYYEKPNWKNFSLFVIFSLLSLPQGFVPQIFLVYLINVIFVSIFYLKNNFKKLFKYVLYLWLAIIIINSFWAVPYFISVKNNAEIISDAKINENSSEDIYLKNQVRGDFKNIISLKGFMLDVVEYNGENGFSYVMNDWRNYSEQFSFNILSYIFFVLSLVGIIASIVKRSKNFYPFIFSFFSAFLFLGNNIFGVKQLNNLLRIILPVFAEAFRFSFTKFSILFILIFSIFLSLGLNYLVSFLCTKKYTKIFSSLIILLSFLTISFYAWPSFSGNFVFDSLKINIPKQYFQTINFFKSQNKNTRIANFPQPNYWSWRYNQGGYRGSGFLWYGIEQPMLDRAFDPWSSQNENYYWEMSYAVYSKNQKLLESTLEKYQINWLLLDGNVINPSSPKALYLNELEELIYSSLKIKPAAEYGQIKIYKVSLENSAKNFVFLNNNLPIVGSTYEWNNYDQAFLDNGNYRTDNKEHTTENQKIFYPFRSLFTGKRQEDLEFKIREEGNNLIFESDIPKEYINSQLILPENLSDELFWINTENLGDQKIIKPEVNLVGQKLQVKVPKIDGYYSADLIPSQIITKENPQNCNQFTKGTVENKLVDNYWLRLSAIDANNCSSSFWLPNLSQSLSYLISVESRYQEGKSLLFWLENLNSQKADIETYLPAGRQVYPKVETSYFIQPPMASDGLGYTLHFDNISIGNQKSVNDLGKVSVYQIPWSYLSNIKFVNNQILTETQKTLPIQVNHPNSSFYEIDLAKTETNTTLILSQSFSDGWQGYTMIDGQWSMVNRRFGGILTPLIGNRIYDHILVNNWENGWQLNGETKIALIFWPQYLEYLGFFFLLLLFIVLVFVKIKR